MKLRTQTALWTLAALALTLGTLYVIALWTVKIPFRRLEVDQAFRTVANIQEMTGRELARLQAVATDYGRWNDTYAFAGSRSEEYLEENYSEEALRNLRADFAFAIGNDGVPLFSRCLPKEGGGMSEAPPDLIGAFRDIMSRNQVLLDGAGARGVIDTPRGLVLAGSHPIVTSSGDRPSRGTLFFGRFLGKEFLDELAVQVGHPVSLRTSSEVISGNVEHGIHREGKEGEVLELRTSRLLGCAPLRDVTGSTVTWLAVELPMDSFRQALVSVRWLMTFVFVAGLLACAAILAGVQRGIVSRIERLDAAARDLDFDGEDALLFPERGRDEITTLGTSLNSMLKGLRRFAKELRRSEERYALSARAANDGLWDWNIQQDSVFYSRRWAEMVSANVDEIKRTPSEWLDRVHPDDMPGLRRYLNSRLEGATEGPGCEYRLRIQTDEYRWMLCRAIAASDAEGAPVRLVGSQTDVTDRKSAEARLLHDALHDSLTGLANRSLFTNWLTRCLSRVHRDPQRNFAVMLLDIDLFKNVNDSLGHLAGDELLRQFSARLTSCLREEDAIARLGGDEFAVLIEDVSGMHAAIRVAQRILTNLSQPFQIANTDLFVGASMGIAAHLPHYCRPEELLRDADIALYRAKSLGRGRYAVFDRAMHEAAIQRMNMETDLRSAISKGELVLHYQPIVSLSDRSVTGVEALIRWEHPNRGRVPPSEFIPVAEDSGLIVPIGDWVIRRACHDMAAWSANLPRTNAPFAVSVNVSTRQFRASDLLRTVREALADSGLEPRMLRLEITESILMDDPDAASLALRRLRDLGVTIALDDFGTGYSSLSYLHKFDIDILKIDRSFVASAGEDGKNDAIIRAVVLLAANMEIPVVAEGVETESQETWLQKLGCTYAQGFLYAKPLPASTIERWLLEDTAQRS